MKCVRGTIDSRLEIRSSRLKNINLSLLGILMTIISAFMLLDGLCGGSILYNIFTIFIGLFGTLFFGAATLFYIRNIFIIKPVLILENDEFYENSSILSMKNSLISWDTVKKIKNMPMMGQGMVSIFMKDQDAYLDKLPLFKRLITKKLLKKFLILL
ncbi:STM3941 family protein [Anaerococcus rubeinfantis]|uniref:STM3941 family protein n=1 Tax=Anaerococcus rubeinfantis TaxID=1720199 RepID=UPI000ADF4B16|nr:STM3941 family protein [Anaerococcus rubeinfantis]